MLIYDYVYIYIHTYILPSWKHVKLEKSHIRNMWLTSVTSPPCPSDSQGPDGNIPGVTLKYMGKP